MPEKPPTDAEYEAAARLREALRRFSSITEQITRAHGLTPQRYQLLLTIKVSKGDEATVGQLSRRLWLGQSAVTQLVRRAEDQGLVRRALSSRDARIRRLRLTREGERRLAGAASELREERARLLAALAELEPAARAKAPVGKATT
jgi:DNA-binding MarR family transcriptional regulator